MKKENEVITEEEQENEKIISKLRRKVKSAKDSVIQWGVDHPGAVIGLGMFAGFLGVVGKTCLGNSSPKEADTSDSSMNRIDKEENVNESDDDIVETSAGSDSFVGFDIRGITESDFKDIVDKTVAGWPNIKDYRISGNEVELHVKYNKRDSTYNAYVGFNEEGEFVTFGNPYHASGPGAIGHQIARLIKEKQSE